MSDGLKLLSSIIATGSSRTLLDTERALFIGEEQDVYDFVRAHLRTHRVLPQTSTVQEETGRRLPTVNEPLEYYVDQVYARDEYTQIRERFAPLREALSRRDMETSHSLIAQLSRVSRNRRQPGREAMSLSEAGAQVIERLERTRGTGGVTGVTSGWEGLDEITGGYQDNDLISWVGRPSLGKTYLLLKQAAKAHADGENVLFVTTEMGQEQIARRYGSIALGINPTLLKKNMISTHVERRLRNMFTSMAGAERFQIFSVGMKANVSSVEAFMQEFGPSLVIIDGVYLLRPTDLGRNMSKVDKITGVYDELKGLNLEAKVPMLLSTQLNRAAGKGGKDASLENIGFADAIGTHSSVVLAVKTGPTENPMASRYLSFLKGREGESGQIAINFKFAPLDMNEFTPEETEAASEGSDANLDWMR